MHAAFVAPALPPAPEPPETADQEGIDVGQVYLVDASRLMFGTDFPPGGSSAEVAKELASLGLGLTDADMRNIDRDNAVRLIPRLGTA